MTPEEHGTPYQRGFRHAVSEIVRGLLLVDADEFDAGALIGALTQYEQMLEQWLADETGETPPPPWRPTPHDLGVDATS